MSKIYLLILFLIFPSVKRSESTEVEMINKFTTQNSTTNELPITTENPCNYNEDPSYFTCSGRGRYPNLNDPSCETYYLCNLLKNGSFVQTLYKCPQTSFFNPPKQVCDISYQCPCSKTTSTIVITTETEEPVTQSRSTGAETTTGQVTQSESTPAETTTKITTEKPTEEIDTTYAPPSTTTNENTCNYNGDSSYFTCSNKSRYPNLNDPSCETYYLCNLLKNGSFVQTLYKCPKTSFFNPPKQVCDISYQCPCSKTTSTIFITTETEEPVTQSRTTGADTTTEQVTQSKSTQTETTTEVTTEKPTEEINTTYAPPFTTTNQNTCNYNGDSSYFTCSSRGRYPNLNDPSCETYYLCNLLKNGSFVQTLYKCPKTSFFNPPKQVCDISYQCPCSKTTSTIVVTTETEEPVTKSRSTVAEPTSRQVTQSESTQAKTTTKVTTEKPTEVINTTYAPPFTTTNENTCNYNGDSSYFTCSNRGRYPNLNDPSCETYYLCNLLKNGSFIQTLYKCPKTSFFNPPKQVCDISYQCPCSKTTSTIVVTTETEEPVTESRSTGAEPTTRQVTQSESTQTETTTKVTTEKPTGEINTTYAPPFTTTNENTCNYNGDSSYFTCSNRGRYPNLNDPSCETYYLCNLLKNGSFVQTLYKCPKTSFFNPPKQVCDISYQCPCSKTTSTIFVTTETEEPVTKSRSTGAEPTTGQVTQSESTKAETTTKVTTEKPTEEINTTYAPPLTTTNENTCNYNGDSSYFTCSNRGRYPNLNDPSCETYYLCNLLKNGSFVQTLYKCPKTSFFNPPKQVCDISYQCPCSKTTSTIFITTETEEPVNQSRTTAADTITEQVTQSKSTQTETTTEITTEKPTDDINTTYAPPFTTTDGNTCNYNGDSSYFTCSNRGRYPNLNDRSCETYYLCNLLKNGSFIQTLYKCPKTYFFNPPKQVCDISYQCPCSKTTSTIVVTTETEEPVTESRSTGAEPTTRQVTQSESTQTETTTKVTTEKPTGEINTTYAPPFTTTNENTCNYNGDSSYFTCSSRGRYPNLNDPSCETYYLCNLLKNGSFVQTLYKCPKTSFFNPPKQVCDISYQCPCSKTTSTIFVTTETEEPVTESRSTGAEPTTGQVTQSESTKAETTTKVTTEKPTGEINTTYAPPFTTTNENTCNYNGDSSYFICSNRGRYPNLNDPSCETYYLCNLLKNGSFVQTLYKCPKTSFFNPPKQVCDISYQCPCSKTTSTIFITTETEEPVNQSRTTAADTITEQVTQSESTQTETTTEVTTEKPTDDINTTYAPPFTTTDGNTCNYNGDSSYFTCSSRGRYPNLNDPSCETYYLCNLLKNGSFVQTLYKCPKTSFFNPPKQVCDISYQCPCSKTTSTIFVTTETEEPVTESRSTGAEPTTGQVTQSESTKAETTTKVTTEKPTEEINTTYAPPLTTTNENTCNYNGDSSYFTCSNRGRYPNLNDPSCETYYLCNLLKNGSFVQTLYKCPKTSFFNPPKQVCDISYQCPCSKTTSTIFITTETEEPVNQSRTTAADTITEQVTQSESTQTETTTEVTTEKPTDDINTTYAPPFTTTDGNTCNYNGDSSYFTCSNRGRYPNLNDPSCETYYLCNLLKNGSFIQTLYKCPKTSFFNPPKQVCDISYQCPCSKTTSTIVVTTETEEPVTESRSTGAEPTTRQVTQSESTQTETTTKVTTEKPTGEINTTYAPPFTTTNENTCNYNGDSSYFICSNRGRYPNLNDPSCETYYLCNLLKNGSFVQTLYKCPKTSFFNPPKQVCDISYQCPCSKTTSTIFVTTETEEPVTESRSTGAEPTTGQVTQSESTKAETTTKVTTEKPTGEINTTYAPPFTTTNENTCNYNGDSSYFICSNRGRYPNLNDPSCETYYLCNLLKNGSFVQTLYKCPKTSFFNPPKQVCDISYQCPCSKTTSTIFVTTETEEPVTESRSTGAEPTTGQVTQSESTKAETTTKVTTEKPTGEINTTYAPPFTTTNENTCNYNGDSSYFICSNRGRYPNLNDPSCETYYLCNLLKNGSFVQTSYKCPKTSFFNPPKQVCDISYQCPCSKTTSSIFITTETEESVTESRSTGADTTTEQVTQNKSTQTETTTKVTTEKPTEEIDTTYAPPFTTTDGNTCNYNGDSSYFICSSRGRYPNLNDPSCETYYLCNLLKNGSFVQTLYKCPKTSFFNPPKQVCDISYQCPCSKTTSSIFISTETEESVTESRSTGADTTTEQVTQNKSTQTETTTKVTTEKPTEEIDTTYAPPFTTTDGNTCNYNGDSSYFICSSRGRYPNLNDPSCETYYLCNLLKNGSFVQTLYKCPKTSFFNPPKQVCDISYQCPCSKTTSTIVVTTEKEEPVTKSRSTGAEPTTRQVTQSESTQAETTTKVTTEKPTEEIDTTYAPPFTTTNENTCNYNGDSSYFICSSRGRYPNLNDPSCETYYLCNLLKNGSFVQTLYKCPKTSFFNPPKQVCDISYQCPCSKTTSTKFITTETDKPVTQSGSTGADTTTGQVTQSESTQAETTTKVATEKPTEEINTTYAPPFTTTNENNCNYNGDSSYFTCSSRGRYPNLNDPSCETYYLCNLLKNGSFVQTSYKCPKTSFFNPPKQVCDISYQCPCSKTTSTVVSTTETEKPVTQSRSTEVETTIEQVTKSKSTQAETTIEFKTDKTILEVGTTYSPPFSTTEYICEYNEDPSYFTCSSKGRYPNLNDPSCETYYLCNQLRNVSFTQTLYKCPKTSFFNPFEQVCDFNYPCPCSTSTNTAAIMTVPETETDKFISTTERNAANEIKTSTTGNDDIGSIFTCPSDGIFPDPEDTNCEYFYVCISSYSSLLSIRSKCPEGTTFDTLFGVCSPFYICPNNSKPLSDLDHCTTKHSMNYICNANGTYVNPNDITCRTYYLCSLQENGTFIQILQKCPATFLYNPTSKTCDAFYKCPCSTTFSTKGVDDQVTESGITESGKPEFLCTSTGVFKDPLDQRCKRFYVCIQSFLLYISVYVSCPSGTLFDPLLRLCSPFYSCPHISKSTTTTAEPLTTAKNKPTNEYGTSVTERIEHEFVCFSTGIFEDPQDLECKKYYVCTKSFLLYVSVHSTCPPATFFDPLLRLCSPFYSCPHVPMSTTTTFEHLTNEPIDKYRTSKTEKKQHEFVCSSTGIFEDTQDFECKKYYICTKSFLLYVSVHSTCPPGTLFDPLLRLCSPFYSCPHIQKSTSTTIEVPSTSITNNCTSIASSHFTCFSNGKYPNLNDLTCSTYYICKKLIIGSFSQTLQSCPIASYFNPVTHACEVNYKCKCNTITDTTIFTNLTNESETSNGITTSMSNEKNDIAFTCLSTGIFQDESDLTCRQFYVCIRSLMSFISIHSTCPTGTFFDPSHRMCSQHYSCPHISKTTSDMNEFTTSERDHCKHVNDSKYSTCSTEGKYPNLMDFTCQTYYSCTLLRNGLFNRSIYTCPSMSFFNPVLQVCEYSYKCPCTTSTASQTERMEFFCPSVGVFADSQDSTCRKFHVCIRFSLSYLSIYSTCPEGTFFDHTFRICSPYYSCQHQLNTTKNIQKVIEMKEVTRIIDSSTDEYAESTTSLSIHLEDSEPIQSSSVTPEEDSCNQLKDPLHFNCSSQGIYPNLNDHTCRTYYICKFLENGSFHQMLYDCPKKSNFNPRSQMCDVNYICPCSVTKRGNRLVRSIGMTGSDDKSVTEGIENDSEVNENVIHDQRRFADLSSFDSSMNICEYSKPFTCNSSGRFPNWNDTTCRTYYLCVPTKSGSFEQIPYTCPTGSFFCPQLKLCYVNYKCPCSSEKRRLSRSIGSERPVIRNESANTSKIMQVMRKKNDSKNAGLSHNLPTACAYTGTIKIFTCNRRSRFPNWNDPTCETYYLCVPLKTGSFVQIQYKCPQGSCFCPLLRVCSVNYKCPCSPDKTRFTRSVDAERFVSENGTTNEVGVDDNEEKMNASSNLLQFRPLPKVCAYNKNLKPFTCYVRGRFPNWNDPTCRSYYLCVPLRTGYFVQTRYTCPKGSFFCPILRVCNVNYECPCSTDKRRFTRSVDAESIFSENRTTNEVRIDDNEEKTNATSNLLQFRPLPKVCAYNKNLKPFTCHVRGRFPNWNDPTCRSYYLCVPLKIGSFVQTRYTCPKGSFFCPILRVCNVNYECPCSTDKRRFTRSVDAERFVSENGTTNEARVDDNEEKTNASSNLLQFRPLPKVCTYNKNLKPFTCYVRGRFPNWNDPTCRSYYLCVPLRTGYFIQTRYTCPKGSFFCPILRVCNVNYECPCSTDKRRFTRSVDAESIFSENRTTNEVRIDDNEEKTNAPSNLLQFRPLPKVCAYNKNLKPFTCHVRGRFPNWNDPTCRSYYLCVPLKTGSFVQTRYTCPKGSFFCPILRVCNVNYECPCSTDKRRFTRSVDAERFVSENGTTNEARVDDNEEKTNASSNLLQFRPLPKVCTYNKNLKPFTCYVRGRFPNWNDPTCRSYYLCVPLRTGYFIQTRYTCPKGSFFCPILRVCNVNYECPCSTDKRRFTRSLDAESIFSENRTTNEVRIDDNEEKTNAPSNLLQFRPLPKVCAYNKNLKPFTCHVRGRFPNWNDPTCRSYYLCVPLKTGSFVQTRYTCPKGSFFCPILRVCNVNYECPCSTDKRRFTRSVDAESIFSENRTTNEARIDDNEEKTNASSNLLQFRPLPKVCAYNKNLKPFTCHVRGRFPNWNDPTCRSYYLCVPLRTGYFIQTRYTCPKGSFFCPILRVCNVNYECPCSTDKRRFTRSVDVERFVSENGTTNEARVDDNEEKTNASSNLLQFRPLPKVCTYNKNLKPFTCYVRGRFPNWNDPTCRSYYLCVPLRTGYFVQTRYTCPKGSFFCPILRVCNVNYECPCSTGKEIGSRK